MLGEFDVLAVIPARSGSKRLQNKNKKILAGKPLIQWTVEAALGSSVFKEVLVSTDDVEISKLVNALGASTPFIRPPSLAQDSTSSYDVVVHALNHYEKTGVFFDYVMLLQPTSPLRSSHHIQEAISQLVEKEADAIISVCESEHSPMWANTLDETNSMNSFVREDVKNRRSQELPHFFRLNGAIYLVKTERLLREKTFLIADNIFAFRMSRESSVDIDNIYDFKFAEIILESDIAR